MGIEGGFDLVQMIKDFQFIALLLALVIIYHLNKKEQKDTDRIVEIIENLKSERAEQHEKHVQEEKKNWDKILNKFESFDKRMVEMEKKIIKIETRREVESEFQSPPR